MFLKYHVNFMHNHYLATIFVIFTFLHFKLVRITSSFIFQWKCWDFSTKCQCNGLSWLIQMLLVRINYTLSQIVMVFSNSNFVHAFSTQRVLLMVNALDGLVSLLVSVVYRFLSSWTHNHDSKPICIYSYSFMLHVCA